MAIELEGLEFQIEAKSDSASKGVDSLVSSFERLKKALSGTGNLDKTTKQLEALDKAAANFHTDKLESMGKALQSLNGLGNIKISAAIPKRINDIAQAANNLDDSALDRLERLGNALQAISAAGNVNISVPSVQTPNVNQGNAPAAGGVAPQAATSR